MSDQVIIQFRVSKELKEEVAEIYNALGMDMSTALRMFMVKSKQVKGIPFEMMLSDDNE